MISALASSGCGGLIDPMDFVSPYADEGRVVLWRESETVIRGYVPVCPEDEVMLGVAVDQGFGPNDGVGEAGNGGVYVGETPALLEFELSPDASLTGSLTDALPMLEHAGPFSVPVTTVADLGQFFVDTPGTYAAWDLDGELPDVGSGWVFAADPGPQPASDLDAELAVALGTLDCGAAP